MKFSRNFEKLIQENIDLRMVCFYEQLRVTAPGSVLRMYLSVHHDITYIKRRTIFDTLDTRLFGTHCVTLTLRETMMSDRTVRSSRNCSGEKNRV